MHADEFKYILTKFLRIFDRIKPLCKAIRGIFFSFLNNEKLNTGTPSNLKKLYNFII